MIIPNKITENNLMNQKLNNENGKRELVWDYPQPPRIEEVIQPIKITFNGKTVANSSNAKRVLERGHPPVYYVPLDEINVKTLQASSRRTWCEWKGEAYYYDVVVGGMISRNAAWYYPEPTPDFEEIRDFVAFYAGKMDACYLGKELVKPQAGDFYGGWITRNIEGPYKGSPIERM
jgi:uncharacterized protein (DUF427 family)